MTIFAGIIGTGFAARRRVEALRTMSQVQVMAVVSRDGERAQRFGQQQGVPVCSLDELWADQRLNLVFICTVNADHGDLVQQALDHGKHVVVEYPLALDIGQAAQLVALARRRQCLLHVEHIELLGGLHGAMKEYLGAIGQPRYVNYRTLAPKQPAPKKWSYRQNLLGFPPMAALSRLQRLTDLFGAVEHVTCQGGMYPEGATYFQGCLYSAQLRFFNGVVAELTYGKGEGLWQRSRHIEVRGDGGCLIFEGDQGWLTTTAGDQLVAAAPRRGLFQQDTERVLSYLVAEQPLYVQPEDSLYSLQVAAALRQATESGERVRIPSALWPSAH